MLSGFGFDAAASGALAHERVCVARDLSPNLIVNGEYARDGLFIARMCARKAENTRDFLKQVELIIFCF